MNYTKLSDLVNEEITILSVPSYQFKMWDKTNGRMLVSDTYEKGYRKLYQVVTDKGQLDLGSGQLGNLLEPVFHAGKADIIGVTYSIKSNGKTGLDIRYYFNPVRMEAPITQDELPEGY